MQTLAVASNAPGVRCAIERVDAQSQPLGGIGRRATPRPSNEVAALAPADV